MNNAQVHFATFGPDGKAISVHSYPADMTVAIERTKGDKPWMPLGSHSRPSEVPDIDYDAWMARGGPPDPTPVPPLDGPPTITPAT